jgi:hypothetical protein
MRRDAAGAESPVFLDLLIRFSHIIRGFSLIKCKIISSQRFLEFGYDVFSPTISEQFFARILQDSPD